MLSMDEEGKRDEKREIKIGWGFWWCVRAKKNEGRREERGEGKRGEEARREERGGAPISHAIK